MKSLRNLATKNSLSSRAEANDREAKVKAKVTEHRSGFDGFLQTFLGKSKEAVNSRSKEAASHNDKTTEATRKDDRTFRDALDKTNVQNAHFDEEMAAAAEEAARIVWSLLYPGSFATGLIAIPRNHSMAGIAGFMGLQDGSTANALDAMGVDEIGAEAIDNAIETANASAEMNSAAVLAVLEETPGQVLRQPLADVSGTGGRYDMFAHIAAALDVSVIEVNGPGAAANPNSLLSQLGMEAERQNSALTAAEISDLPKSDIEAYEIFEQFLQENFPAGPSANLKPKQLEDLFESFARRFMGANQYDMVKGFFGEVGGLAKAMTADFPKGSDLTTLGSGASTDKVFSWVKGILEILLQNNAGNNGSGSNGSGGPGSGQDNGGFFAGQPFANIMAAATAHTPNDSAAGMSNMLQQMENIERLTEAMKMANRGSMKNITLQLSPAELGKVLLKVETRDGVVTASLRVEKAEAIAQLSENLKQLRENLRAQGVQLGEVDIQHYDFGHPNGEGGGRGDDAHDTIGTRIAGRGRPADDMENDADDSGLGVAIGQGNGLNLFA